MAESPAAGEPQGETGAGSATPSPPSPDDPLAERYIEITGPRHGRWRAGRHFGPEAVRIRAADLTDRDIDLLSSDPTLRIRYPLP